MVVKEYLELLFSRVQSFYIKIDDYDPLQNWEKNYREDIKSSGYLTYPPPIPSLQSITIDEFYEVTENYGDIFIDILITSFETIKANRVCIESCKNRINNKEFKWFALLDYLEVCISDKKEAKNRFESIRTIIENVIGQIKKLEEKKDEQLDNHSKKQEIINSDDNEQTNNRIEIEINKIIESIKATPKTLLGLIKVLRIYDSHKENESIRVESTIYFNYYHEHKYQHYFDKKGYMNFILNIFFDSSFNVFNQISNIICSSYIRYKLYKKIINDKRFNNWFKDLYENDKDQLEKRLHIMNEDISPNQYIINHLHSMVYDGIKDNSSNLIGFGYYDDGTYYHNYLDSSKNLKTNCNNNNNNNGINLEKSFIISDIIVEKIVRDSLWYVDDKMDKVIINHNLLSFALVSKQFFKVLSKILNDGYFEWKKSMIQFNDSEFNLIKQPPLYFDYNSIRLIPYSSNKEYLELLFSRVQSFYIKSDEYDSTINDGCCRKFKCNMNSLEDEELIYREDIESSGYLIYPPPMPLLQSITIDEYYGYSNNYIDLFTDILITSFETDKLDSNCCGIKRFSFSIFNDWNGSPESNIDFIKPLLEYHLDSLEKVEFNSMASHLSFNTLNKLKSSINNQSKNRVKWSLNVNYGSDNGSYSNDYEDGATDDESF
ncbi:hypothetical protein RB653_007546 [Dictyostelium firmibasis]|uniref:Uncharacterized protein n=1 Tax=Dictyostelium firmibasis TaxID=79012 RepID=A0AAN7TVJ1_9MYCE